jgi:peptidoglycan/LPS O-acetylase OafA/YrhL
MTNRGGLVTSSTEVAQEAPKIHSPKALPGLTGLRFIAALAVVLSHFTEQGVARSPDWLINDLDGGRTAVSLFFVLSGFVLAYNYFGISTRAERHNFYVARFARLYPVVLLSLLIAAIGVGYSYQHQRQGILVSWYAITGHAFPELVASLIAQLAMAIGWFPLAAINQPWNAPAWSISCEVFFYVLFPFLLSKLRKFTIRRVVVLGLIVWAVQGVWIVAVNHLLPANRHDFIVSQFPVTHLFEFFVGVGCAIWFVRIGHDRLEGSLARLTLLGVAASLIVTLSVWHPVHPVYYLMTVPFGMLILALAASPTGGMLGLPLVVLFGEASFSLYMVHMPIIHIAQIGHVHGGPGWLLIAGVIGFSVVVYRLYETPSRRKIRSWGYVRQTVTDEVLTNL